MTIFGFDGYAVLVVLAIIIGSILLSYLMTTTEDKAVAVLKILAIIVSAVLGVFYLAGAAVGIGMGCSYQGPEIQRIFKVEPREL